MAVAINHYAVLITVIEVAAVELLGLYCGFRIGKWGIGKWRQR